MIEIGSIGWDDEAEYIYPGDESNDGHTLVRVQLFKGRDPTKPLNPRRAQGTKLIAHINALGGFRTPPKDTRCYVAVRAGMEQTPGAAIVIGLIEKASARFDNLANGSIAMSAGSGEARVITNNDGSVTIYTTSNNERDGKSVYMKLAPDGVTFVAPWGTIKWSDVGFHLIHSSGASIDLGGIYGLPAPLDELTSYIRMQAATINGVATAHTFGAGDQDPLAGATPTVAALAALNNAVGALAVSLTALASNPTLPGLGAFAASFNAPVVGAAAVVAASDGIVDAANAVIPSSTFSS